MRFCHLLLVVLLVGSVQAQTSPEGRPVRALTSANSVRANQMRAFDADTVYTISGIFFVDSLATLTVEAGTVVKFGDGQNFNASALVVSRGGKLFAEGTVTRPIVFTSINDNVDDPDDMFETVAGVGEVPIRGDWGGIVLLGAATTNNPTAGGVKQIEGLNQIPGLAANRISYGGTNDDDNSGVLRYVSIRHSGINIGDAQSGNEIQGLTLGAVGRGTRIEYVESYASNDDGFEWFGGTVDTKYLVSVFNADDAFDWDEGFRGRGQFWFALQSPDEAGRAAEMDGATNDEFYTPFATPVIYNATFVGAGAAAAPGGDGSQMLIFRDNTGGQYWNSIFTDFQGAGLTIEDVDNTGAQTEDSRKRLEAGQLALSNNLWFGFKSGNALAQFAPQGFVQAYLSGTGTQRLQNPQLRGISRVAEGRLDPRPAMGSPAFSGFAVPTAPFFDAVAYVGAFGQTNWLAGWTALEANGYLGDRTATEQLDAVRGARALSQSYPNPVTGTATIEFALDQAQQVRLALYDVMGREVAVLVDGVQPAGTSRTTLDASGLASGLYIYRLTAGGGVQSRALTVAQ